MTTVNDKALLLDIQAAGRKHGLNWNTPVRIMNTVKLGAVLVGQSANLIDHLLRDIVTQDLNQIAV